MFLSCILYQLYIFSENTVEKVRKPIRPRIPLLTVSTSSPSSSETTTTTAATTIPLMEIPTVLPTISVRLPQATDITTTNRGGQEDSDATTTLKTGTQERETHSPEPATTTTQQQLVVESTELAPMVVVDNLDTLAAPEISSHKAPPPPLATQPPVRRTITTLPPATVVTTTLGSVEVGGTTLSPAREMVDEFTNGIHAAAPEKLSSTAIETIRKNFEQKKNIFEQFVSFGAQDKAFVPNSEVFTSDWSARADPLAADKSVDSKSRTEPSTATTTNTPISVTTLAAEVGRQGAAGSKFSQERNSEGGFKPMIKPLFSPLS